MLSAIGQILGNTAGVAVSPVPVIALILMLLSPAAIRNSVMFLVGWILGLAAEIVVVLVSGCNRRPEADPLGPATATSRVGRAISAMVVGVHPHVNTREDGYLTTAPVKAYRPNGFGLYNMAGNVWEWRADPFDPTYYQRSPLSNPPGPDSGESRAMRGGSFLCHDSCCNRCRVSARSSNTPDSASANLGFRCANNARPVAASGGWTAMMNCATT